jgi:hypothetical protein
MLAWSQANERRAPVSQAAPEELGPVDYVVMEWPGRRQAERRQRQGTYPYDQPAPAYEQPEPVPAAPPAVDPLQQLKDLAELKDQGVLTEEEFAAQKARILGR